LPKSVVLYAYGVRSPNVPGSGVQGINQGNPDLVPEVGTSLTFGAVLQPRFLPGFSLTLDYYRIKITNVIAGLSGQGIINQCYDDPGGISNPYCDAVFRRGSLFAAASQGGLWDGAGLYANAPNAVAKAAAQQTIGANSGPPRGACAL